MNGPFVIVTTSPNKLRLSVKGNFVNLKAESLCAQAFHRVGLRCTDGLVTYGE